MDAEAVGEVGKEKIQDSEVARVLAHATERVMDKMRISDPKQRVKFASEYSPSPMEIDLAKLVIEEQAAAEVDPLTGLRRKEGLLPLVEIAHRQLMEGEENTGLGLVDLDFDYFSWLNDIFKAHKIGDLYLHAAGEVVRENLRLGDVGVRRGGDEFSVLVLGDMDYKEFGDVTRRLHGALNSRVFYRTLEHVLNSQREAVDPSRDGKVDLERTVGLRQFLKGILQLLHNEKSDGDEEGARDSFLKRGKGDMKDKRELIERIEGRRELIEQLENGYLGDVRPWKDLDKKGQEGRKRDEAQICALLRYFLEDKLTVSVAGVYVDKSKASMGNVHPDVLVHKADGLVYAVKETGRGKFLTGEL